jgi:hypothetical protein
MHAAFTDLYIYHVYIFIILTLHQQLTSTTAHYLHYVMMVFYYVQTFLTNTHFSMGNPHSLSLVSLRFQVFLHLPLFVS